MAAPARLQRRDALILKNELNVNMVRCSHYPQSPHFLDACDELGIMVWQEPPGWGFMGDAAFQQRFLERRHEHDRPGQEPAQRGRLGHQAGRDTRTTPPSTPPPASSPIATTGRGRRPACSRSAPPAGWADDVFSYDDYRVVDGEPELFPPVPGVPYLISETVGAAVDPQYRWFDPPATLANQAYAHALVHDQAQANPSYAGVLAWAAIDYYAAPNPANPVAAAKNWDSMRTPGVLDVFRVPKPGASIYQSQVAPAVRPVIIACFWWDNASPPGANSMFATNCDRLELSVNGTRWLTVTPDAEGFGALRYPPAFADLSGASAAAGASAGSGLPDLRVDGYVGTRLAATLQMTADTSRDKLSLAVADTAIAADGSDATAVTIRVTDAYGNHRPGTAGDVDLTLTGPATLIAANPFPLAEFGGVGGGLRLVPVGLDRPGDPHRHACHAGGSERRVDSHLGSVRKHVFEFRFHSRAKSKTWCRTDRCSHPARSAMSPSPKLSQMSVCYSELGPREFRAAIGYLVAVYAAAMNPPERLIGGREAIMDRHAASPGFRRLTAVDDGVVAGFG